MGRWLVRWWPLPSFLNQSPSNGVRFASKFSDRCETRNFCPAMNANRSLRVIEDCAASVGIGMVECWELDQLGMTAANRLAMERAVFALDLEPSALLLDAVVTDLDMPQVGLIDGDALCLSIAAASIVAKVTRDRLMIALHDVDSRYGLDRHVGYGTRSHLVRIAGTRSSMFSSKVFPTGAGMHGALVSTARHLQTGRDGEDRAVAEMQATWVSLGRDETGDARLVSWTRS